MIRKLFIFALGTALSVTAAHAQSAPPAPAALAGLWTFEISAGAGVTRGAMTLAAEGANYRGMLMTDQGTNALPVRSATVAGRDMAMRVESPNGNVTFQGRLDPAGRSFAGTVTYFDGRRFPMSGRRQ